MVDKTAIYLVVSDSLAPITSMDRLSNLIMMNPQVFKNKKLLAVLALAVVVLIIFAFNQNMFKKQGTLQNSPQIKIEGAKDKVSINKEFEFPLKNSKGDEVSKIRYTVESVELRKEILLKGKKASAVSGRIFFIANVKIANSFDKTIEINSKDYLRLVVGNNEGELLAADIHSDPVRVQAISTKYTRLGFPVNDSDKEFKLKIGEINGEKIDIEVKFK